MCALCVAFCQSKSCTERWEHNKPIVQKCYYYYSIQCACWTHSIVFKYNFIALCIIPHVHPAHILYVYGIWMRWMNIFDRKYRKRLTDISINLSRQFKAANWKRGMMIEEKPKKKKKNQQQLNGKSMKFPFVCFDGSWVLNGLNVGKSHRAAQMFLNNNNKFYVLTSRFGEESIDSMNASKILINLTLSTK